MLTLMISSLVRVFSMKLESWIYFQRLFFIMVILVTAKWLFSLILSQEVVWVNSGLGWDGVYYNMLLDFFSLGGIASGSVEYPFCARIAAPFLVSMFGSDGFGFYELNLFSSLLFLFGMLVLGWAWWRDDLKSLLSVIFLSSFLFFSPVRFVNFYPVYTDPPFMALLALSAIFAFRGMLVSASFVCVFAIPFREAAFYVLPLYLVVQIYCSCARKPVLMQIAILCLGFVIKGLLPSVTGCVSGSQIDTALVWAVRFITNPQNFISSISSILMTLGPLLILATKEKISSFCASRYNVVAVLSIPYFAALSIVGGSDTTRIFYSFIPMYGAFVIYCFRDESFSKVSCSILGWMVTNQIFNAYEQPATQWPNNDLTGAFAQTPDYAHPVIALVLIAVWGVCFFLSKALHYCESKIFIRSP